MATAGEQMRMCRMMQQELAEQLLTEFHDLGALGSSRQRVGGQAGGSRRPKRPREYGTSSWAQTLEHIAECRENGVRDELSEDEFQSRFRFSYDHFLELIKLLKNKDYDKSGKHASDKHVVPFELKVLGVLRVLGRGWLFDDVAEATKMDQSTVRRFFHNFCATFVDDFFHTYVHMPAPGSQDLRNVMNVYATVGLDGCVGSVDCVHLAWGRCPYSLHHLHVGKEVSVCARVC